MEECGECLIEDKKESGKAHSGSFVGGRGRFGPGWWQS